MGVVMANPPVGEVVGPDCQVGLEGPHRPCDSKVVCPRCAVVSPGGVCGIFSHQAQVALGIGWGEFRLALGVVEVAKVHDAVYRIQISFC